MYQENIRCVDCKELKRLTEDELIGKMSEKYGCKTDETSKTLNCIYAIKNCSRFVEGEHGLSDLEDEKGLPRVRCQDCGSLIKVNYKQSQSTHHENWECPKYAFSMQYEDTLAVRFCGFYNKGIPKNKAERKY